jgi:hypothetical protein
MNTEITKMIKENTRCEFFADIGCDCGYCCIDG